MRNPKTKPVTLKLSDIRDEKFYRVADLKAVLQDLGLNFSIFSIMNAETWKCLNYECGKRYKEQVITCPTCGSAVSEPKIPSPRTNGGGKGAGHRRYTGTELKKIIEIFKEQRA